jgi:PAS domain S-box-containing protein
MKNFKKEKDVPVATFSAMPFGMILLTSKGGNIMYMNSAFTEITGYAIDDFSNVEDAYKRFYPNAKYREEVAKICFNTKNKSGVTKSFKVICKDGSIKHLEFTPFFRRLASYYGIK